MKKTLAIMLALIMVLAMVPALAEGETTITSLDKITGAGSYILGDNIAVGKTLTISAEVTIDGSGKTITYADGFTETMFNVTSGGKLTLKNVTIDGGNAWEWDESTNEENWYDDTIKVVDKGKIITKQTFVVEGGSLILGENTKIQNCVYNVGTSSYNNDYGVIKASSGNITLSGARIEKVAGTIVYAKDSSLILEGSTTISNNYGCGNKGGLFIVDGGNATMNASTSIKNNKAWVRSGVIFGVINSAKLTIKGGEITENEIRWGGDNTSGPMICLESGGEIVMNGGSITNNTGKLAGAIASRWVTNNNTEDNGIHLNGGTISGNKTKVDSWKNADVFTRGTLEIGKDMTVKGNVVVDSDGELKNEGTIDGDLVLNNANAKATSSGNVTGSITKEDGATIIITAGQYGSKLPEGTQVHGFGVNFDANGGSVNPAVIVYPKEGGKPDFPTPTHSDYAFVGWYTEKDGGRLVSKYEDIEEINASATDGQAEVTPMVTLYAHWTEQPQPSTDPSASPTPTPGGGNGGGYYYPTTTPVPVIVIPPKTGDMTVWQSILHFLGIK